MKKILLVGLIGLIIIGASVVALKAFTFNGCGCKDSYMGAKLTKEEWNELILNMRDNCFDTIYGIR